jgi:hypothetical protein
MSLAFVVRGKGQILHAALSGLKCQRLLADRFSFSTPEDSGWL